jgi:hypothetical protein
VGEAQGLQELADGPLVVVDAIALGDHLDTSGNPLILARLGVERLMLGVFGIS